MTLDSLIREAKARERRRTAAPEPPGPRRKAWGVTGYRGVYLTPTGRYQGKVRVRGRLIQCGTHDDPETAAAAVAKKLAEMGVK